MASYEEFALIYDWALNELPYDGWVDYIEGLFKRFEVAPKLILDLGCGTGSVTNMLAQKGYDMIGVDMSHDMLAVAIEKAKTLEVDVTYINQNMMELDLYGTVDCVISVGDALNYIIDEEDLLEVFKKVNLFLDPGGLFVFDMNTVYKFREILGNQTYAENHEDYAYIWENFYYEEDQVNEYEVNIFIKNEEGSFDKTTEIHYERGYEVDKVVQLLQEAGLKVEAMYHDQSYDPIHATTERMYFIAREVIK